MMIVKREFHCRRCGGIKILMKEEPEPEICPFCGVDRTGKDHHKSMWVSKKKDNL